MDNINYSDEAMKNAGIPYNDINWKKIEGQPFGSAASFNVIVFNDANNIVDVEGPVAIGGDFYSPRGLSVGFGKENGYRKIDFSPNLVRYLSGGNVSMTGPLVVIGHVVTNGGFRAAKGSTYLIGKDGRPDELMELKSLYQANGGSKYWTPTDKGDHYIVPSYDVPRYIPAERIGANIPKFFNDARESIEYYKNCIEDLNQNGNVVDNNYEWILRGNDKEQNVFIIDVRPNGLINKGIRAEVPDGSKVIVRLRTGANAHLQYGVYGERSKANDTLYVFEDATNIYMEKSSDIWGSILAPQAMFHAHSTGGHVSGNAALGSFAVNSTSGFEFHYYPFVGEVKCKSVEQVPVVPAPILPTPEASKPEKPVCPECPTPKPCPTPEPCPTLEPCPACPTPEPCPMPKPCPICPVIEPCPVCPTCQAPEPCPVPKPCPVCPTCQAPEPCPVPKPCPVCPTCPTPKPCPVCPTCPAPKPCPVCPTCPAPKPCPVCPTCPVPEPCLINPGFIRGCILGCHCGNVHEWQVELYKRGRGVKTFLFCVQINSCGYFEFEVPYEGCYILNVSPIENCCNRFQCKPIIVLKNVGVANFMIK